MSLLNDALKQAEQRQQRPAPAAYTGQGAGVDGGGSGRRGLLAGLGLLVVLGIVGYTGWQFVMAPQIPASGEAREASLESPQPQPPESTAEPAVDEVVRATAQPDPQPLVKPVPSNAPAPAVVESPAPVAAEQSARPAEPTAQTPLRSARPEDDGRSTSGPEPRLAGQQAPQPQPEVEQAPEPSPAVAASGSREPASPQVSKEPATPPTERETIKQARQTPAQRDLSASREIRDLVAAGELAAAEAVLTRMAESQAAPRSRYVFARGVLARGDVDRALAWAPADLAQRHPDLRLIRARALLAGGDLDQAVTILQTGVPPVADHVEYRVTLATLLQQQGDSAQAARHWAELIAWDNGRAPWWVGLAIALEGRGDVPAARRAYQQAADLPGLAPSLADYVRQRLQILGAG